MTVQELIDLLKDQPRSAHVVLGGQKDEFVFVEAYDVFGRRAVRHYTEPNKFVAESYGEEVVVIA